MIRPPESRLIGRGASRPVLALLLAVVVISAPAILLLQQRACGVEQWPPVQSPAIGYGLLVSGILGLLNGVIIASRQPGNRIAWISKTTGMVGLAGTLANRYAMCGMYGVQPLPGLNIVAWFSYISAPLIIAMIFWQIPFWFPYGEYLSNVWRRFARLAWVFLLVCVALIGLLPGELSGNGVGLSYTMINPFGINFPAAVALRRMVPGLVGVILLTVSVAANLSLVLRWKQARGDERQQIKWFAFFVGVVVTIFLHLEIIRRVFSPELAGSPIYIIAFYLAWIGYPVVIVTSVLKYRLYDIDIVIRRTLSYGIVSLLLALVYLSSVTVLQLIIAGETGQRSSAAIVVSTLLIAALFNPLRRQIQAVIDRRFYRSKYDAARTLERFSVSVRNEVELEPLIGDLQAVVDETLQPEAVGVWLLKRTA